MHNESCPKQTLEDYSFTEGDLDVPEGRLALPSAATQGKLPAIQYTSSPTNYTIFAAKIVPTSECRIAIMHVYTCSFKFAVQVVYVQHVASNDLIIGSGCRPNLFCWELNSAVLTPASILWTCKRDIASSSFSWSSSWCCWRREKVGIISLQLDSIF